MLLIDLTTDWFIFIIVALVIVVILAVILISLPIIRKNQKKNFQLYCYKKINHIVLDNDYYLINNFLFRAESSKIETIDHIIFAEKYIYLIFDYYYEGDLTGSINDKSLILISFKGKRKGKKSYTENPFISSEKIMTYLSYLTGIDKSMFINIILVNDQCNLAIESNVDNQYLIQRKRLYPLIKAIESREVSPINQEQLDRVVKRIAKLNRRKD